MTYFYDYKMYINILLFIFTLTLCLDCYSQKKLNLYFSNSTNEKEITLRYSILGLINYAYEPYIHKYKTSSSHLSINIPDSITSFLMQIDSDPHINWGKNVNVYIDNGENLDVHLDTILPPKYIGNNTSLHEFIFLLKNGTGSERSESTLYNFLNDTSTDNFFDFIHVKIKKKLSVIDSLYSNSEINENYYYYAKGIVIDDYLYRAGSIGSSLTKDYLQKVDSASFFSDIDKLYNYYDTVILDGISLERKAALRGMDLIPRKELDLGLNYDFMPSIYLNKEEQEVQAASEMIVNTAIGKVDSIHLNSQIEEFTNAFPNSRYTPILLNLRTKEKKDYSFAHFSQADGFNELGTLKVNNLTDLTKMFLGGQSVLIDFWATWCAPCIKEFKHKQELDLFLKDHNIGIFYVSLDYGGSYKQWKETIVNKKLDGFHYLATPELGTDFPYFKESNSIPRLILLDKEGNVLIENCELPSSGKLIPQIKTIFGLK